MAAGAPELFRLPAQWSELNAAIGDSVGSPSLRSVLAIAGEHRPSRALLENDYIDVDYRDEYSNFYATTFRGRDRRCRRLHFFREAEEGGGEIYLGFCVLRPIDSRPVGRTFLQPPDQFRRYISCLTTVTAIPYGQRTEVTAFPFMEQDAQFGVCAHASIWMAALYHHYAHGLPRRVVSEIASAANARVEPWRSTPSEGLSPEQVGVALQGLGLRQIVYAVDQLPEGENIQKIACRYLNSRLPVVLTTDEHATVLIGYGRDRKGRIFFVRSDESRGPYVRLYSGDDPSGDWDLLFVPLPGRIYLAAESAEIVARERLTSLLLRDEHRQLRRRAGRNLRLRCYARRAGEYKADLTERGVPGDIAGLHRYIPTSNWVWVVELQDSTLAQQTRRCVLGEIAIDATSDRLEPNPLFANLPGRHYAYVENGRLSTQAAQYEPYLTGSALHDAPTAPPVPRTLRQRVQATRRRRRRRRARRARRTQRRAHG